MNYSYSGSDLVFLRSDHVLTSMVVAVDAIVPWHISSKLQVIVGVRRPHVDRRILIGLAWSLTDA